MSGWSRLAVARYFFFIILGLGEGLGFNKINRVPQTILIAKSWLQKTQTIETVASSG